MGFVYFFARLCFRLDLNDPPTAVGGIRLLRQSRHALYFTDDDHVPDIMKQNMNNPRFRVPVIGSVLLLVAMGSTLVAQTNPTNQTLVLKHVAVIDMTGAPVKPDMVVVITGNRIAALGRAGEVSVPQNAIH